MATVSDKSLLSNNPHFILKAWMLFVAMTPIIVVLFRSYIGLNPADQKQVYGYSPILYMATWLQVGSALFLLVTSLWLYRKPWKLLQHPLLLLLCGFIVWMLASLIWSTNLYEAILTISHWLAALAGLIIIVQYIETVHQWLQLYWLLFISAILVAALGIGQYLIGLDWVPQYKVPASTFAHKNLAAHFIILALPMGLMLYLNHSQKAIKYALALGMATLLSFLVYTTARAAWVAVGVQLVVLFLCWFYERRSFSTSIVQFLHKPTIITALLLLLVMLHLSPNGFNLEVWNLYWQESSSVLQEASLERDGNVRLPTWINTVYMASKNWLLGVGAGNWSVLYPAYQTGWVMERELTYDIQSQFAHNDWLQYIAELGIIGLFLLVAIGVTILRLLIRLCRHESASVRFLGISQAMLIAGIGTNAIFSTPLQGPLAIYLVVLTIGFLTWLDQHYCARGSWHQSSSSVGLSIGLVALSLSLLVVGGIRHYHYLVADLNTWKSAVSINYKNYREAVLFSLKAFQLNPENGMALANAATAALAQKDYPLVAQLSKQMLSFYPYSQFAQVNLAYSLEQLGDYRSALKAMQQLLAYRPNQSKYWIGLARLYLRLDKKPEAMTALNRAAKLKLTPSQRQLLTKMSIQVD